jgi:molecular chaperone GrpE (heat shock protein)
MSTQTGPKLLKWPFFLGDAILLGLAYFIFAQTKSAFGFWESALFMISGILGALLAVAPFVLEYQAAIRMVETGAVVSTVGQIQNLEIIISRIGEVTAQWQGVQGHCAATVATAQEIAAKISAEAAAFTDFLSKAGEGEKAHLRLELEKMRRVENDWLQIIVRMLDHTYALHQAAVRSGQPGLVEQLTRFQNSCRDVARRVGLVPFVPSADEPFDSQRHQSADAQSVSLASAQVSDTVATGFTYQGRLLRQALVTLKAPSPAIAEGERAVTDAEGEGNGQAAPDPLEERTVL